MLRAIESSLIPVSVSASAVSRIRDPGAGLGELRRLLCPYSSRHRANHFCRKKMPKALEFATAAAVTTAILHGAAIVRVHDVLAMKPVVQTADAIVEATPDARRSRNRLQATA